MGLKVISTPFTRGAHNAAALNCDGPVKTADGNISPNTNTKTTLNKTAAQVGASLSTKMGEASFAKELHNNKVTSTWWCGRRSTNGSKVAAWRFSVGVPVRAMTRSSEDSRDVTPIVRPAAIAAHATTTITQLK